MSSWYIKLTRQAGKRYNLMLLGFPAGVVLVLGEYPDSYRSRHRSCQSTGLCERSSPVPGCCDRSTRSCCARVLFSTLPLTTCPTACHSSTSPGSPSATSGESTVTAGIAVAHLQASLHRVLGQVQLRPRLVVPHRYRRHRHHHLLRSADPQGRSLDRLVGQQCGQPGL